VGRPARTSTSRKIAEAQAKLGAAIDRRDVAKRRHGRAAVMEQRSSRSASAFACAETNAAPYEVADLGATALFVAIDASAPRPHADSRRATPSRAGEIRGCGQTILAVAEDDGGRRSTAIRA